MTAEVGEEEMLCKLINGKKVRLKKWRWLWWENEHGCYLSVLPVSVVDDALRLLLKTGHSTSEQEHWIGASENCIQFSLLLLAPLLWMGLECLKVWYFSAMVLPLSYISNVGRDQEGSEICLSSSADLLRNPCPRPRTFAHQALLENFMMGESYLSKASRPRSCM